MSMSSRYTSEILKLYKIYNSPAQIIIQQILFTPLKHTVILTSFLRNQ